MEDDDEDVDDGGEGDGSDEDEIRDSGDGDGENEVHNAGEFICLAKSPTSSNRTPHSIPMARNHKLGVPGIVEWLTHWSVHVEVV